MLYWMPWSDEYVGGMKFTVEYIESKIEGDTISVRLLDYRGRTWILACLAGPTS